MRYIIVKFDTDYGPPIYRVSLRKFLWRRWLKDSSGRKLNFDSKADAHAHMRGLSEERENRSATRLGAGVRPIST